MNISQFNTLNKISLLFLLAYFCKQVLYSFIVPVWQGPDEPGHFDYVVQLAETKHFPQVGSAKFTSYVVNTFDYFDMNEINAGGAVNSEDVLIVSDKDKFSYSDRDNWIAQHPPLFYILSVPFYLISRGGGLLSEIYSLRFFNILLATGSIYFTALAGREVFGKNVISLMPAILLSFYPQFSFMSSVINNDNLVFLFSNITIYLLLYQFNHRNRLPLSKRYYIIFSLILGLGSITKYTFIPITLAGTLVTFFLHIRYLKNLKKTISCAFLSVFVALVVAAPWYVSNYLKYNTFFPDYGNVIERTQKSPTRVVTPLVFFKDLKFLEVYMERFLSIHTWRILVPEKEQMQGFKILILISALCWVLLLKYKNERRGTIALLTFVFFVQLLFLTVRMYGGSVKTGGLVATHARYIFPVIIPICVYISGIFDVITSFFKRQYLVPSTIVWFSFCLLYLYETWIMFYKVIPWFYIH